MATSAIWQQQRRGNRADRVEALVSASPEDEDGKTREEVVKTEIEDNDNNNLTIPQS